MGDFDEQVREVLLSVITPMRRCASHPWGDLAAVYGELAMAVARSVV